MTDEYRETQDRSWFGQLGGSLGGAVLGLALFVASFFLLSWNEKRAVDALVALDHGQAMVISVPPAPVDPANDGRLIHVSGPVSVTGDLTDPSFQITAPQALRLRRQVEMYQWHQTKEEKTERRVGGGETTQVTYRYALDWSATPIRSGDFAQPDGHANPAMPYSDQIIDTHAARLGDYQLQPGQISQLDDFISLSAQTTAPVPPGFHWDGDILIRGQGGASPQLGDIRIRFSQVPAQPVSVIAAQSGRALTGFHGDRGVTIALIRPGIHDANSMFAQAKTQEATLTWILRVVGFVMMTAGLVLAASPLVWLANILPFLGSLAGAATFVLALVVSIPLSAATIALAWIAVRPLIAVAVLAAGVVVAVLLIRGRRSNGAGQRT